jgi:hypothetical protein
MARAPTSGITLGYRETCVVKGMLARSDRQHDIASYFGVNPARINEIASGEFLDQSRVDPDLKSLMRFCPLKRIGIGRIERKVAIAIGHHRALRSQRCRMTVVFPYRRLPAASPSTRSK